MKSLDQIENSIKSLIEKSSGLFSPSDQYTTLIHHLCESIQNYLIENTSELNEVPAGYFVYMNPEDARLWKKQENWQKSLSSAFIETLTEFGYKSIDNLEFSLLTRNSLSTGEISIKSIARSKIPGHTDSIDHSDPIGTDIENEKFESIPTLLFRDNELIQLKKNVVNIGRRSTNDIVINDLRISRIHAQIRKSREGFMIFDVGSSGGTFINGERKLHHLLRSGDVISLAGYTMVFTNELEKTTENEREKTAELTKKPEQ